MARAAPAARRPQVTRQAARQPQDQVARLLLQRCAWWHELTSADHELLVGLAGWHAELFRWIERWLAEHGPASWTELREPVEREAWGLSATTLIDGAEISIEPQLDELQAAVMQTRRALDVQGAMRLLGRT